MQLEFHFDPRTEPVDDRHETVHGEPSEVRVANARKIGCGDLGAAVGGTYAQAFPVERVDDLELLATP